MTKRLVGWKGTNPNVRTAFGPIVDKMQDFLAVKKISRGARQVFSADRWGLVGEAAALLDPFYSPGSDFIAIGNTMVGKLIEEDLAGRSIAQLAPTLQSVFLTLFQNNLLTYRDQYPLFGNPRIMALEVRVGLRRLLGISGPAVFQRKTDRRQLHSVAGQGS